MVAPTALGSGRALFAGLPRIDLRTDELTRFDDGTFVVRYRVIKELRPVTGPARIVPDR